MSAAVTPLLPAVSAAVPAGMVWQYKVTVRGGHDNHTWALNGPRGGIHVDAWETTSGWRDERWMGGIESHSPTRPEHGGEKPSHEHCWLLAGTCWHDGSSLQFSEQIAPYLPAPGTPFREADHLDVLSIMVSRYNQWLPEGKPVEAVSAEVLA